MAAMWKFAILAAAAAAAAPQAPVVSTSASKWHVEDQLSQLDDARTVTADLDSANLLSNGIGSPEAATLFVQCDAGELTVYVVWPPFMGNRDREVRWKFDAGSITKEKWRGSESGTATFDPFPYDFLAALSAAKRFVIDAPPFQQSDVEAVFDTAGADKVVTAAMAACPKP
ncbi:MAG: hypothetical protein ABSA49_07775 [Rhizomicrobium sp.]|jgi:hypothetical protein